MKRKWLNLRIDIAQLDPLDLNDELQQVALRMINDLVHNAKTMSPLYDTHGRFLGLWKTFEGEEVPSYEMTTEEPLRR